MMDFTESDGAHADADVVRTRVMVSRVKEVVGLLVVVVGSDGFHRERWCPLLMRVAVLHVMVTTEDDDDEGKRFKDNEAGEGSEEGAASRAPRMRQEGRNPRGVGESA